MTLVLVVLVTVVPVLVIVRGVLIALVLVILIALRGSRGLTARRRSQVGAQAVYFLLRELAAVFYRKLAEFVSDIFVLLVYRVRVSAHVVARRHGLAVQAVERLGELIRGFLELIYRPAARLERFRDVTVLLVVSNGFLAFIALQVLRQVVYLAAQGTIVLVGTLEVLGLQLVHKLLTISDETNQACLRGDRSTVQGAGDRRPVTADLRAGVVRPDGLAQRVREGTLAVAAGIGIVVENLGKLHEVAVYARSASGCTAIDGA